MKRLCLVFTILFFGVSLLTAQSRKEWERAGDMMMKDGYYRSALSCYKKALGDDQPAWPLGRKITEAARLTRNYKLAADYYDSLIKKDPTAAKAGDLFLAALLNKQASDFEDWQKYIAMAYELREQAPENVKNRIAREYQAIEEIMSLRQETMPIQVRNAGNKVNTNFAETAPFLIGDSLLFFSSSSPAAFRFDDVNAEEQNFQLMQADVSMDGLKDVEELGRRINEPGFHNANPALSSDGSILYFARCPYGLPGNIECQIWYANKVRERWGRPRSLSGGVNLESTSSTHPTIAVIGGKDVLYFASNREGGYGGWDIWYTVLENNRPTQVVNLGLPVNSVSNEWAPRVYNDMLYFSSDAPPGLRACSID